MTMTDSKGALTELLAKVEAGKWCTKLALKALPESHVNDSHEWIDPIGWASRALHNGSLDAAKALHEAIPTNAIMDEETAKMILFGRDGARTWLTWKLRALIAGEDTNANDKGE